MPICRDLLKYDYSNFSLTIIEYCEPSELKKREKHFIKLLNSAYNLIKNSTASPMSGRKHTEQSQHLISITKKKIDNSGSFLKGQTKIKGAFEITYKKIEVFDKNTNQTTSYDSISEAARALNITKQVISYHLKALNPKPYKGRYTFSVLISNKTTTKHSAPSIKE